MIMDKTNGEVYGTEIVRFKKSINLINSMSEELIKRNLKKHGIFVGDYEYYNTHDTTIKQYKQAGAIKKVDYGKYEKRRSDGLLIDRVDKDSTKGDCQVLGS